VQRNALKAWDEGQDLKSLVSADENITSRLPADAIDRVFSLDTYLRNVDKVFARVFA
jgi:adenylosuccinate lyase